MGPRHVLYDIAMRLLHPAVQALLLGVAATTCVCLRRTRTGALMGTCALAWVAVASAPAFGLWLRSGLVAAPASPVRADAIVVLGGGRLPRHHWDDAGTRAGRALGLWRDGYASHVIASGNDEARDIVRGFAYAGVPATQLLAEDASRTTRENAERTAELVKARGWQHLLLVTSPLHERRASAAFRRVGLDVTPVPSMDRLAARLATRNPWWPTRSGLSLTARCMREWLAYEVYRWRGWA